MAEWVQKGNLKGPQGDPGQDAQLPAGGTEGQVLTKTADGEAWEDVPAPDMTGVVKTDSTGKVIAGGSNTVISFEKDSNYARMSSSSGGSLTLHTQSGQAKSRVESSDGNFVEMTAQYDVGATIWTNGSLKIGSKSITSITDDASTGSADALATAKAVKDYVDAHGMPSVVPISQGGTGATTAEGAALMVFAHAPEASPTQAGVVKTLSDEDFCAYMGMEYDPADWS